MGVYQQFQQNSVYIWWDDNVNKDINWMDPKHLEHQLKNYKLREATLEKRSKFLKEWRDRWVVVTQNYLFTFKSQNELTEPTDILDLRQINSIKTYLKKFDDMDINSIKITTEDSAMYFKCKTPVQKWSWIVFLERLLEHKHNGSTNYNDFESIRKAGFVSVDEYEKKGGISSKGEVKQSQGYDLGKVLKAEEPDAAELQRKAAEEAKRLEERRRFEAEEQKRVEEARLLEQKRIEDDLRRREQEKQSQKQEVPQTAANIDSSYKKVSDIKNMFEKKIEENTTNKTVAPSIPTDKNTKKQGGLDSAEEITSRRNTIVGEMFNEFKMNNSNSFKDIASFLVDVAANQSTGFSPYVVHQSKHSNYKNIFAEVFIEQYTENPTDQEIKSMLGFLYIVYHESIGLFTPEQAKQLKKCLIKFLGTVKSQQILAQTLKSILIVHNTSKFDAQDLKKNTAVIRDLEKNSKSDDIIGIAKKAKETFGLIY